MKDYATLVTIVITKQNMSHIKQYVKLVHEGECIREMYVTTKQPVKHIFTATIYTFLYFPVQSIFLKLP